MNIRVGRFRGIAGVIRIQRSAAGKLLLSLCPKSLLLIDTAQFEVERGDIRNKGDGGFQFSLSARETIHLLVSKLSTASAA